MSYLHILPYGWVKENGSQVFFALGVNDVSYYTEQTKEIINLAAFQREVTKITDCLHERGISGRLTIALG